MSRRWRRTEDGVTAVLVAILAVLMFSLAALAVDLSNAFSRKRDVQSQADFAALAGGSELPNSGLTPSVSDTIVDAVADYMEQNQPQDDSDVYPSKAEYEALLTDGGRDNGEIFYGTYDESTGTVTPDTDILTVLAPKTQVDFGLASVMGVSQTRVQASATVAIRSPGTAVMPVYAVTGCDYGPQTITQPTNGQVDPVSLWSPNDTNGASLTSITPTQVALNSSGVTMTITGSNFIQGNAQNQRKVTTVGFFQSLATPPPPEEVTVAAANVTATQVSNVTIPTEVTAVDNVWYVRVGMLDNQGEFKWSNVLDAQLLQVGTPILTCAAGSNSGNFGTLILPRTDSSNNTTNGWLPINMAVGLEPPLSLRVYPGDYALIPAECNPGTPPAVYSATTGEATLVPQTNCVDTDTGLPATAATAGLVTGAGGYTGRLNEPTTDSRTGASGATVGCDPTGTTDERTISLQGNSQYNINNDVLTCFFTQDMAAQGVTVNAISQPTYAGPTLSSEIYESPRFFWQPVLKVQPTDGGSQHYSIVDFRGAFLTDQALTATKDNPLVGLPDNGVTIQNNQVRTIRVVFIAKTALPAPNEGPTIDYLGIGPKSVQLVD